MQRLWILVVVVGLLSLCGCPKPKNTNVSITNDTPDAAAPATETTETPTDTSAPAETPEGGQQTADSTAPDNSAPAGDTAHKPTTKELEGKWFALYGGTGMGAKAFTFENGHQIQFMDNGVAIWSLSGNGGNGLQVVSKYELNTGDISVIVEKPDSITQSAKGTPLSFGRDDEVGLTGSGAGPQPAVFRFTPEIDRGYLALIGRKGELMVYGRTDGPTAPSAPDVSGDWKLTSPSGTEDVKVTMHGEQMEVNWGPYHNDFKGTFSHGYFIGEVTSSAGTAFAAVVPAAGGMLDGVISTEPYSKWQTTFDFTRASQ